MMKQIKTILLLAILGAFGPLVAFADDTSNTKVGIAQGGEELYVKSGGSISIQSGGSLELSGEADLSAGDVTLPVGVTVGANEQLAYVDVTISSAELLALNATPKTIVAAPGAGKALVFENIQLFLDYNTTAYDGIAAGEDLSVKYTNAAGQQVASVEATGFLDASADALRYGYETVQDKTPVANAPLVLHMLAGEIATGNSPLKVRTFYKVIPSTL
jgi:hypothetical protein